MLQNNMRGNNFLLHFSILAIILLLHTMQRHIRDFRSFFLYLSLVACLAFGQKKNPNQFGSISIPVKGGARATKYNYQKIKAYYISELIKYCLFRDEPKLANFQINESKYFRNYFERTHQNTHQLRKLDLKTRLFKTRCSYMLGSRVFNELPESFKISFINALREAISNKDSAYANLTDHLSIEERKTILKVLLEI